MNKVYLDLKNDITKCTIRDAINDAFPIVIGFIPIAMAFGILSKSSGISLFQSLGFSMIVFAGASQFIAINLLTAGASFNEIIITTLLVNFRHFLFAASLSSKLTKNINKSVPLIAFGLTDEIFSVASLKDKELTSEYLITLEFCAYLALAIGTLLGFVLGGVLPEVIKLSMGIALYSLFASILVPEMKKSFKVVILLLLSGFINTSILYVLKLPQGWSMIISIVVVSILGIFIKTNEMEVYGE